jgi:hypothetical protein
LAVDDPTALYSVDLDLHFGRRDARRPSYEPDLLAYEAVLEKLVLEIDYTEFFVPCRQCCVTHCLNFSNPMIRAVTPPVVKTAAARKIRSPF